MLYNFVYQSCIKHCGMSFIKRKYFLNFNADRGFRSTCTPLQSDKGFRYRLTESFGRIIGYRRMSVWTGHKDDAETVRLQSTIWNCAFCICSRTPFLLTRDIYWNNYAISPNVRKCTFGHVHPAKIQISQRIRAVWSESSLGAFWIDDDANFHYAENEDTNQTARMRRLIWVFIGRTCQKVRFLTLRIPYLLTLVLLNKLRCQSHF